MNWKLRYTCLSVKLLNFVVKSTFGKNCKITFAYILYKIKKYVPHGEFFEILKKYVAYRRSYSKERKSNESNSSK